MIQSISRLQENISNYMQLETVHFAWRLTSQKNILQSTKGHRSQLYPRQNNANDYVGKSNDIK